MVSIFKRQNQGPLNLLDLYLFFSTVCGVVLWTGFGLSSSDYQEFFLGSFFISSFVVINWHFFSNGAGKSFFLQESWYLPELFLFQFFMLLGMANQELSVGCLYLAIIPCLAGTYFVQYKERNDIGVATTKTIALFLVVCFSYILANQYLENSLMTFRESLILGTFFVWQAGIMYWANSIVIRKSRLRFMDFVRSQKHKNSSHYQNDNQQRDRFFYHDILNQTHGINLFLNQKINSKKSLTYEECMSLANEVKMMQSLLKDHYGYSHRDLVNTYNWVSFEFAKNGIYNLVRTYLPEHEVECHFLFKGLIAEYQEADVRENCKIHYPTFYRIIHNLVKNISEQKSEQVEFVFDYTPAGLNITIKNKIFQLKYSGSNLAERLGQIILNSKEEDKDPHGGVGLESVATLAEDLGGSFQFELVDEFWVNEVFLPLPENAPMGDPEPVNKKAA